MPAPSRVGPRARSGEPFGGAPYRLLRLMEERFADVFCYRLTGPDGRRQLLLAVLDEVRTVTEHGPLPPARLAGALDEAQCAADAAAAGEPFVGDVVFALSHDLQWSLRPPELPAAPAAARPRDPLAVLARIGSAAVYDETGGCRGPTGGTRRSCWTSPAAVPRRPGPTSRRAPASR
ncbi:hypothetical protein GCM10020295_22410 [Streptomyces cinereospinus]